MTYFKENVRIEVWNKFDKNCAYCGKYLEYEELTIDHVQPIYRGALAEQLKYKGITKGTDDIENLYPSCEKCNNLKDSFTLEEWRNYIKVELELVKKISHINILTNLNIVNIWHDEVVFYFEQYSQKNATK